MVYALLFFTGHFFMHLISSSNFFIMLLLPFLFFRFFLLLFNQSFDHRGLGDVLIILMIKKLLLLLLFFFGIADIMLDLFSMRSFIVVDFLSLLFLLGLVKESHVRLLIQLHLHSHMLFLLHFLVTSPLRNNVACFLPSLIDFFVCAVLFSF